MKKNRRKNNWVTNGFFEALEYLRSSKNYIWMAIALFFMSALFAFLFSERFIFLEEILMDILLKTEGLNGIELIVFIFRNNFMSALFALILGVFLSIIPVMNALLNGAVLGYVAERVGSTIGFFELWRLLPHGIFELPAIFIAIGLGIKLGMFVFIKAGKRKIEFWNRLDGSLKVMVFIILPLLIMAAVIEGVLISLG